MITADTLARKLGCTLADLDDLDVIVTPLRPHTELFPAYADMLRRRWSERTGVDYAETAR